MSTTIRVTGLQEALDALSVFQRAQIPFAASWGLNQLGYQLVMHEREYMQKTFNSANRFTLLAPIYDKSSKNNLSINYYLRDNVPRGNSPDRYLAPQVEGGPVYVTRFSRALRRIGGENRLGANEYVMHWANPKYPSTGGRINSILAALRGYTGPVRSGAQVKRAASAQGKYFMLGTEAKRQAAIVSDKPYRERRTNGYQGPGIYTRKASGQLELVYRVLAEPLTVDKKYEWNEQRIGAEAQARLPGLIMRKLETL